MSGLVDMWTTEMAKLKEKGQTLFSKGSGPSNAGSFDVVKEKEGSSVSASNGLSSAFSRVMGANSALALCSEASISMIVECSSP
ncbi:hypothetical protein PanWU01x14_177040 [Parasponia andersonii]|uniref:Uncharacterized protein n=1 Tax=Parasponia andersonii TaxID=3476 RepID=A0A2P5C7K8_PARAD|nr:hypothetical protein PanWU01x14_177040 [Parasponia andersonii]